MTASLDLRQNTVDMSLAIQTLMSQGELIPMRHLAALSPYITRRIKKYGDYVVNLHNIPQPGKTHLIY
ncbi:Tn3 family transposase [Nostoc sp. NMS9]|uniref:Tn3 family transposase n=1 Tax=Nostoc sp. NMS9 TaxID=2815393 RepID=UPI003459BD24|nr:Tn3 family transposase [Nostoc sp. NMS9]